MTAITPVLLAGGSGTRLWPLSRKSYPKQFSPFTSELSLFQQSALRLKSSKNINFLAPLTLTNSDYRFIVSEQLKNVDIEPGTILIEPYSKNTGPAILAASLYLFNQNDDALILVSPSDHLIENSKAFHEAVNTGLREARSGKLVLFGINPTRAETGYGYIEIKKPSDFEAINFIRFVEKPEKSLAEKMISDGNYLWNAGIFLFYAKDIIYAYQKLVPSLYQNVRKALEKAEVDLDFLRLDAQQWTMCDNISIDYAVMENAKNLAVVKFKERWSDLGGWDEVWNEMGPDKDGVSVSQNAYAIDCQNTLLRSETDGQTLVGLGLDNIMAIAMPDAVLVADKAKAQRVKAIVPFLKDKKIAQAEIFHKNYRPWGWFESLVISKRFQVKKIFVKPGHALSLQSHSKRSEHWVVVEGEAKVTIGEKQLIISEGQSVYVPLGIVHRLENKTRLPMILIEVQIGTYLGEDDIVRYDDRYARK